MASTTTDSADGSPPVNIDEVYFADFVNLCNESHNHVQQILEMAHRLADKSEIATEGRRIILNMDRTDPDPTWKHLYKARLAFELKNPQILRFSPKTGHVSLSLQIFRSNDPVGAATKAIINKKKIGPIDTDELDDRKNELLYNAICDIACTLRPALSRKVKFIQLKGNSGHFLFGISPGMRSPVTVPESLRRIEHRLRRALVERLLEIALAETEDVTTVYALSSSVAKQIHFFVCGKTKHAITHQQHHEQPKRKKRSTRNESIFTNFDDGLSMLDEQSAISTASIPHRKPTLHEYYYADAIYIAIMCKARCSPLLPSCPHHSMPCFRYLDQLITTPSCRLFDYITQCDSGVAFIDLSILLNSKRSTRSDRLNSTDAGYGTGGPFVIQINEAISQEFKMEIMKSIEQSTFMKGRAGRERAYMRIATSDHHASNTFFHTGPYLYPAVPANECENAILAMVNSLLSEQTRLHDEVYPDRDSAIYRNQVNTLQIMVEAMQTGSGYSKHSDAGDLVNMNGELNDASLEQLLTANRLPLCEEMQTITIVLTTLPKQQEHIDTHQLKFTDISGKYLGSIRTDGNMVHFQMHGSQIHQHQVTRLPRISIVNLDHHARIVISCRHTAPSTPGDLRELFKGDYADRLVPTSDYSHKSVLSHCTAHQSDDRKNPWCTDATAPVGEQHLPPTMQGHLPLTMQEGYQKEPEARYVRRGNVDPDRHEEEQEEEEKEEVADDSSAYSGGDDDNSTASNSSCESSILNSAVHDLEQGQDEQESGVGQAVDDSNPFKIPKAKFRDCYPQVPLDIRLQYSHIHRVIPRRIGYGEPSWKFLMRGDVCGPLLLRHHVIPCANFGKDHRLPSLFRMPAGNCPGACLRLLRPLECFPINDIARAAGIAHYNRANPPTTGDPTTCMAMMLSRFYKQNPDNMNLILRQLRQALGNVDLDRLEQIFADDTVLQDFSPITVNGSGGSAMTSGAYASTNIQNRSKMEPNKTAPAPQCLLGSKQNKTMFQLAQRRAVVALFLDVDKFRQHLDPSLLPPQCLTEPKLALFLGYHYFESQSFDPITAESLHALNNHLTRMGSGSQSASFLEYSSFNLEAHFQFVLRPVFRNASEVLEYLRIDAAHADMSLPIPEVGFSSHKKKLVAVDIPINEAEHTHNTSSALDPCQRNNASFIEHFIDQFQRPEFTNGRSYACIDSHYPRDPVVTKESPITAEELTQLILLNMVAGGVRFLERNIVYLEDGTNPYCAPIAAGYRLPTILSAHPHPLSFRTYDTTTLRLILCAVQKGIVFILNTSFVQSQSKVCRELLLMAIFNRFTGRYGAVDAHRNTYPAWQNYALPTEHELPHFWEFVESQSCLRSLFNPQHKDAIPAQLKESVNKIASFFSEVASRLETLPVFDDDSFDTQSHDCRKTMLTALQQLLKSCYSTVRNQWSDRRSDNETKLYFLAHLIMADLEEIYKEPFGPVNGESVPLGTGSREGIKLYFAHKDHDKDMRLQNVLDEFLEFVDTCCEDSSSEHTVANRVLEMMGCSRSPCGRHVVVALNRRPLNVTDSEHFMCKLYIGIQKTLPGRCDTAHPQLTKPGHHPLLHPIPHPLDVDGPVSEIMSRAVQAYVSVILAPNDRRPPFLRRISERILLLGEVDPLV